MDTMAILPFVFCHKYLQRVCASCLHSLIASNWDRDRGLTYDDSAQDDV